MISTPHSVAIIDAINGLSSKEGAGRGYGLGSTVKILLDGLGSDIFIVSGYGAVFLSKKVKIRYNLTDKLRLDGTLISFRIPYPSQTLNIYDFID